MVNVVGNGLDFWIDVYEASRPDAQEYDEAHWGDDDYNNSGTASTAACAFADKIPWTMVSKTDADSSCWKLNDSGNYEASGWKLCSADQWQHACPINIAAGAAVYCRRYGALNHKFFGQVIYIFAFFGQN